uniref:uncharacterized protein isoform X2 n=1 Tax=Myxine glutinosa TaxID=7769 RepID=UPI00358DEE6B
MVFVLHVVGLLDVSHFTCCRICGYCVFNKSSPGSCPCFTANRNATCPVEQCEEPESRLNHLCTFNVYLASHAGGREAMVLSEFKPVYNVVPPAPNSVTIQGSRVMWEVPDAVYLKNYIYQVDYRKLPDGKWQNSKEETSDRFYFVPHSFNLMVRVRARPNRVNYGGFWSIWSPVVHSQATVPPDPSNYDTGWLFLYCILPLSVVCSLIASIAVYFQRERIRHKIWPTIPDPKHWLERVLPTGKLFSVAFKTPTSFCEAPFIPVEIVQSLTSIPSTLCIAETLSLQDYYGEDHPGVKGVSGLTYVAVCSTGQVVGAGLPEHPEFESQDIPAEKYGEDAWEMPMPEAYISAEEMSKAVKQASDHGSITDPIASSCGKPFAFDLQISSHKQTSPSTPLVGQPYIAEALVRNADCKRPCSDTSFVPETFIPASIQPEPTGCERKPNEESATEQTSQRSFMGEGVSGDAMVFLLGPVHCSSLDSTREESFKDLAPAHHDGPVIYNHTPEHANLVLEFPNMQTVLNNHHRHQSGDDAEVSMPRFHLLEPLPTSLNRSDVSTSEMDLDDYAQISSTLGPWELECYLT